ncbi:MAG: tetratricopeptide repeat protein [Terracidiphilus sp.]
MNNCYKLVPLMLLALLARPAFGLGQQAPASRLESLMEAAQQAQAAHDYATAANDYKKAVGIEPNMPELWANLGLMQQQAGDIPSAILSFQKANHLNPALYVPNLFLGIDLVRTGKAPEAIPFLTKAEKINKTDPQTPLALGRAYFAAGKFSQASREFAQATALDPTLGPAWFALGIARLNQVETDARKMSIENKSSSFAGALYAESLEKQARFSEAATLYRSLLALQPQPPCILSDLGFALLRHRDAAGAATEFAAERAAHPECGMALLGQARIAIDGGDNAQSVKLLEQLWARDHGFVVSNAGVLLEGLSDDAAAAVVGYFSQQDTAISAELRNALLSAFSGGQESGNAVTPAELPTRQPAAQASSPRHTAEEHYAAGQFTLCSQQLSPAVNAARADKLRLLAACSYFAGDNDRALSAANALETLQPHSPEALYWSIQANQRLALKSLAHFQQLESDSAKSHVLLGDIYVQLERFDDAQSEYIKALSVDPGDAAARLGLASAYLGNGDIDKAIETAQTALERTPEDPELNLVMVESLVAKSRFAEAEPFLSKSLSVKPQMLAHVHALIGRVYAETGRPHDAIDQLKLGVSSDENGSVHYLLARLYRQVGDLKDASLAIDQMKAIKQQRHDRGVKTVEDPDLSSLESPPGKASTP